MVAVSWSRCGRWETLAKAQRPSRPNASLRGLPAKESESLYAGWGTASSVHVVRGLICTRGMGLLYVPVCSDSRVFCVLHVCRFTGTSL